MRKWGISLDKVDKQLRLNSGLLNDLTNVSENGNNLYKEWCNSVSNNKFSYLTLDLIKKHAKQRHLNIYKKLIFNNDNLCEIKPLNHFWRTLK